MKDIHSGLEYKNFEYSENVSRRLYCTSTGLLATTNCSSTAVGYYKDSYMPVCTHGGSVRYDTNAGSTQSSQESSASSGSSSASSSSQSSSSSNVSSASSSSVSSSKPDQSTSSPTESTESPSSDDSVLDASSSETQ